MYETDCNLYYVIAIQRRDERRRATHNEVERRRRDKINNWIMKLGKIIPDCGPDQAKQGQVSFEGQVNMILKKLHLLV
jgi:upstream stimulatory factor